MTENGDTTGKEANGMNRSLIRCATYVQLCIMTFVAAGCTPTQPFFANESSDLRHYLDTSAGIEHPDMRNSDLLKSPQSLPPLTLDNHQYEYWDMTLEECVAIALQNAKFMFTVPGTSEERQNVIAQFASGSAGQFGSIYDTALQQTTTQTVPLAVDSNGNRVVARGVQRANQVGGVEDALAEFDAQYSSVFSYSTTDRPRNVDAANGFNAPLFQGRDGFQQSAISKRMATGGVATLRQQTLYSWNNLPVGAGGVGRDVRSDWTAILEAQVTHPLMRGRGTMINRIPVVLARLNEDITITEFEALVRNLVYDVERTYWDLYCAYRNVETEIIARNAAQATAFATRAYVERGGTGTIQEQLLAEARYYEFRNRLQGALAGSNVAGSDPNGVYGLERELRARMGLEATDGRLIRPVDEPTIAPVEFDWYVALEELHLTSPELRRSKIRLKQAELELIAAKNRLLPQVDGSITGRLVGVGDELGFGDRDGAAFPNPDVNVGATGSSALAGLTEGNYAELALRLEITPTAIGQRRELAAINNAKLEVARQKAWIFDQERALQIQLAGAMAKLQTHYRQIQTNAAWLNSSEGEYTARIRKYLSPGGVGGGGGAGGATGGDVDLILDAQQRRAQAQISYYRSLCEYNKSIAYVHNLKGSLLAMNSIELQEGPWSEKAYWDALERARERSAGYYYKYGVTRPNVVSTGSNLISDKALVEPLPSALAPEGVADELILGFESVDGQLQYPDGDVSPSEMFEGPIGSGVPGQLQAPAGEWTELPEVEIPGGPQFETVPVPPQAGRQSSATGLIQPVSHTELDEKPQVMRRPVPKPLAIQ